MRKGKGVRDSNMVNDGFVAIGVAFVGDDSVVGV